MEKFKFCPHCKSPNIKIENQHRLDCEDCGLIFYQNIAAAVAVIIEKNGKILFTKRNKNPQKGWLDLPGGFTDPDESIETTCARELKEELNLNFTEEDFHYFYSHPNQYEFAGNVYRTQDLIFTAQLPSDAQIELEKEEIMDIRWIKLEDVEPEKIAFPSLRKAVEKYLQLKNIEVKVLN